MLFAYSLIYKQAHTYTTAPYAAVAQKQKTRKTGDGIAGPCRFVRQPVSSYVCTPTGYPSLLFSEGLLKDFILVDWGCETK